MTAPKLSRAPTFAEAEHRIAQAALRWKSARSRSEKLEKKRNAILCERSNKVPWGDPDAPFTTEEGSCWKGIVPAYADGSEEGVEPRRLTPEEQCESCRERYAVHLDLKQANRRRGAAERSFWKACAAWPA